MIRLIVGALIVISAGTLQAENSLPRRTPETQGVASAALIDLVDALDDEFDGMHSLMVVRHGNVIAEGWWAPYDAEHNHVLYSLSKSFTSTAVGMAVAEGKLSIDDLVVDLFPDETPSDASANLKAMRVRDLLTMSTGHQDEPSAAPDVVSAKSFLAQPVPHLPGTHFKYNTAATFMQSAIVQKVTGQTVRDYLQPRLFEPLGIEDPVWDTNYQGICLGGYGLRVRTEDIAKFGQLYLQKGVWKGEQLLPAPWVQQATAKQVSNGSNPDSDWNQGYGFQFWRCRHNAYRGDGAFGQYCVVMPDQDVVVAITSGVRDMQAVLNVIWNKLLPACQAEELAADRAAMDRLHDKLASLEVPAVEGNATSDSASRVLNQQYVFPANDQKLESVTLSSTGEGENVTLAMVQDGKSIEYPAGYHQWKKGRAALGGGRLAQFTDEPVAGTFAWESDDTVAIKVCAFETPFHRTFKLRFADGSVTLDSEANVAFGPRKKETLVGQRARPAASPVSRIRRNSGPAEFVVEPGKPFIEDFSEAELDRTRWNVEITGRTVNNEQQAYVDSSDTLYIAHDGPMVEGAENDGVLVIHPRWREGYSSDATRGRRYDFISGRINTRGKVELTHGTAAARIKMTPGAGLWPAFWLLGNGRWPATGEIDIMEYVGDVTWVSQAVHGPGYSGNTPIVNRYSFPEGKNAADWHVYAVDWTDSEMVFKVDGNEVYRATKAMIEEHGNWAFDNPKFVIVNFALGGGYPQGVNHVSEPYPGIPQSTVDLIKAGQAVYQVDWVRVSKDGTSE